MSDTKSSTVAEIKAMPEDATIFCFIGTITARHKRSSGTNKRGTYSFETFEVKDAKGEEIRAKFVDCEPLAQNLKAGSGISILAVNGSRGWSGVKAKDNEFPKDSGQMERVIWVTPSAVVSLQATPGQPSNREGEAPAAGQSGDGVRDAKQRQVQLVNLMQANLDAAAWLVSEFNIRHPKFPMGTEDIRAIAATLQIGCEHAGCGQLMPTEITKHKK